VLESTRFLVKDLALTISFTGLYVVLSFMPLSPIIGLPGKTITAAAIMAPVLGSFLGFRIGVFATFIGGLIGVYSNFLSPPSLVSGVLAALFAGLIFRDRRRTCTFLYIVLLTIFGFYPFVGPIWLFPLLMWFQIAGFVILISPLQSKALKKITNNGHSSLFFSFFVIFLPSTLAGQIAGSLTFEVMSWPILIADINAWKMYWQFALFMYPIERTIIALGAAFFGVVLYRISRQIRIF